MLINQGEVEENTAGGETKEEQGSDTIVVSSATAVTDVVNSQAALLQALQLYSRNLFLPSLKDQTILQAKILDLGMYPT